MTSWPRPGGFWNSGPLRSFAVVAPVCLAWWLGQVWFGSFAPRALDWMLVVSCFVPAALGLWRAGTAASVPPAAQRYWRTMAYGIAIIGVSMAVHIVERPTAANVIHGCGAAMIIWAQIRLPIPARGSSAKRALWLDVVIVMASAAVLIWHVACSLGTGAARAGLLVAALTAGVFLLVKLVLVGSESLSPGRPPDLRRGLRGRWSRLGRRAVADRGHRRQHLPAGDAGRRLGRRPPPGRRQRPRGADRIDRGGAQLPRAAVSSTVSSTPSGRTTG